MRLIASMLFAASLGIFTGAASIKAEDSSVKVYHVGVLFPALGPLFQIFRQELQNLGYVEGKNLVFESRLTGFDEFYRPDLAQELVDKGVDVIAAAEIAGGRAGREATTIIPIVVISCDPYELLVRSLARPGGNVTGQTCMTSELTSKKLALFKEMVPGLSRIAFLYSSKEPGPALALKLAEETASTLGLEVTPVPVGEIAEITHAFEDIAGGRFDGLFVYPDWVMVRQQAQIVKFAAEHHLPAFYGFRDWASAGGLLSYGTSSPALVRRAAGYVDKILKGAHPSDLPVEQPTKFELIINLKTAKALGLDVPASLLAQADMLIE